MKILCAIYDSAVLAYVGQIMTFNSAGEALRTFIDEVNRDDPQNQLNRHPEDFTLQQLATYDPQTGIINAESPRALIRGKEAKTTTKE